MRRTTKEEEEEKEEVVIPLQSRCVAVPGQYDRHYFRGTLPHTLVYHYPICAKRFRRYYSGPPHY